MQSVITDLAKKTHTMTNLRMLLLGFTVIYYPWPKMPVSLQHSLLYTFSYLWKEGTPEASALLTDSRLQHDFAMVIKFCSTIHIRWNDLTEDIQRSLLHQVETCFTHLSAMNQRHIIFA